METSDRNGSYDTSNRTVEVKLKRTVVAWQRLVLSFGERHSGIALNGMNADVVR